MARSLIPTLLFLLGLVLLHLGTLTLWRRRRRDAPGALPFGWMLLCGAIYSFGYGGELLQGDLEGVVRWLRLEFLGIPWIPALWIWTALDWAGHRVSRATLWVLGALSTLTFLGHQTNGFHGLFYDELALRPSGPFLIASAHRGPFALLHIAYVQLATLVGAGVFLHQVLVQTGAFRRQAALMLLGSLAPWATHLLYLLGGSPLGLDVTPFAFTGAVGCFALSLFWQGLFDRVPVAWAKVVEALQEAVLVVDPEGRLVAANPSARLLIPGLECGAEAPTRRLLQDHPALLAALEAGPGVREVALQSPWGPTVQEVRVVDVPGRQGSLGRAAILADVTDRVRLLEEVRQLAETDALTGVANRRRFETAFRSELERSARTGLPFCLLILDVDHFKRMNDVHGHGAGDAVLVALSHAVQGCLRRLDQVARVGGEEFALLLPQTDEAGGRRLAERIRARVAAMPEAWPGAGTITVSLGLVACPGGRPSPEPEDLYQRADGALYRAKFLGRNRVCVAGDT